jgi:hypothetical protein
MTHNSFSSEICKIISYGSVDKTLVIVDAHVHIHDCYVLEEFFDHAFTNLRAVSDSLGAASDFIGILMLTEAAEEDYFSLFAQSAGPKKLSADSGSLGPWNFETTDESSSLVVTDGHKKLILIAGRQVKTAENLEVLMLGTEHKLSDGQPIHNILEQGRQSDTLLVIPWGAGKWWFNRGTLMSELIRSADPEDFFLGDEGGRPIFWPTPKHFKEALKRGFRLLQGTDPLPFTWESKRVGTYGFWLQGPLNCSKPTTSVKIFLRDHKVDLHPFGKLETPLQFFLNQIGLRVRKQLTYL